MVEKNLVRVVRDHAGDGDEVLSGWQAIMLVKGRNKNVVRVVAC